MRAFAKFAADAASVETVASFYRQEATHEYGEAAGKEIAPLLTKMDNEHWWAEVSSPEFYPYDPSFGRLSADLRKKFQDARIIIRAAVALADTEDHRANVEWLAANIEFALLLDQVSAGLESAYLLEQRAQLGEVISESDLAAARRRLQASPIEELFRTYAARVRSRGELGVLSSLNQKLWGQYRDSEDFLNPRRS
jgi:hypothetical protein